MAIAEHDAAHRSGFPGSESMSGRIAAVIGGSRGIGLGVARALCGRGCRVVVASRGAEHVREATEGLQGAVGHPNCDVRVRSSVAALFEMIEREFDHLDIVVYSAGIGRAESSTRNLPYSISDMPEEEWDAVLHTNLRGMFWVVREAARIMVEQRHGQIVNISSARGALKGNPYGGAYCASKMAARVMFKAIAEELEPFDVRAFSVLPDAVDTELISNTNLGSGGALSIQKAGEQIADLLSFPPDFIMNDTQYSLLCRSDTNQSRQQEQGKNEP